MKSVTHTFSLPSNDTPQGPVNQTVVFHADEIKYTKSYEQTLRAFEAKGREQWHKLHTERNPTLDWFNDWLGDIPGYGCSCAADFMDILNRIPVRWNDWFPWTVEVHNAVNAKLDHPQASLRDAMRYWRPDLLPRLDPIGGLLAVTSLAPNPKVNSKIIDSWKRVGLDIVCVQTPSEIEILKSDYGQVSRWVAVDDWVSQYQSPTVLISDLLAVSITMSTPILLINSDIEIDATEENRQALIDAAINGQFSVGVRWNHPAGLSTNATMEPYGLDAFLLSPDQSSKLKLERYEIGKPMWDYWLPFSVRYNGHKIHKLPDRMFLHASHEQRWGQKEWLLARTWFEEEYSTVFDWNQFRAELL